MSVASQAVSGSVELCVWRVSPTVGKFLVTCIIPSAVQVSQLRKSLSESLVTYTICRLSKVLSDSDLSEHLRIMDDSTQDLDTIVVHGVHLHGDRDQATLTQAEAMDGFYTSQAALAACVGHCKELYRCQP